MKDIIEEFQRAGEQLIFQGERSGNALITQIGNQLKVATLNANYVMDNQRDKLFNDLDNRTRGVFDQLNAILASVKESTNRAATIAEIANLNLISFLDALPVTEKTNFYVSSIKGLTQVFQRNDYYVDFRGLGFGIAPGNLKYVVSVKIGKKVLSISSLLRQNATDLRIVIPNKALSDYFNDSKLTYVPLILTTKITRKERYWIFFEEEVENEYVAPIQLTLLPRLPGKIEGYEVLEGEVLDGKNKTKSVPTTTPGSCSNENKCYVTETINLAENERAVNVYYVCHGGMCSWSYPQRPGKGYEADYDVLEGGTKVQCYRVTEGGVTFNHYVDYQTLVKTYTKKDFPARNLAFNTPTVIELSSSNPQGAYSFKIKLVTGQETYIDSSMSSSIDNLITRVGYSKQGDHYNVTFVLNIP